MSDAIIPRPRNIHPGQGRLRLTPGCPIRVATHELSDIAALLAQALDGGEAPREGAGPGILLTLDAELEDPEAYRLTIDSRGIELAAATAAGCFAGTQTLLQLMPAGGSAALTEAGTELSAVLIQDRPAYRWRGMHLDCSRHFFSVDFIKRFIDLLAMHRMNRFHWHLCDDQGWRLESLAFPRLTEVGARRERTVVGHTANRERHYDERPVEHWYSRADIREVVAYASRRHIQVVPEIDVPGHAAAILAAYPELGCGTGPYAVESHFGIFPDVLCPGREGGFEFLQALLAEVAELFPCEYVHIGGDEVIKTHWQACPHCRERMHAQGMDSVDQLHGYFVTRVEGILAGLGRRAIGWDEILDGDIGPRTTIMCWSGMDACRRALEAGHQAVMTPVERCYFDFYQSTSLDEPQAIHGLSSLKNVYHFDPLPQGLPEQLRGKILGAQANVWTEYLRDDAAVEYAILPRMSALAEVTWTGPDRRWQDFCRALPKFLERLEAGGHRVSHSAWKPTLWAELTETGQFSVRMACDMPGLDLYYSLDGSEPGPHSSPYTGPFLLEADASLRCCAVDPETGRRYGDERLCLARHLALGCPVYTRQAGALLAAPALAGLTDGRLGRERIFHAHEWSEFGPGRTEVVVDLGREQPLRSLSLDFEAGAHRLLYFPSALSVSLSSDASSWRELARTEGPAIEAAGGRLELAWQESQARYLKLAISNEQTHYSPEQRSRVVRPVYLDQLLVG